MTETIPYLQPRTLIEISSRSLRNPFENRKVISFIDEVYPNLPFSNKPISVPTVLPTRTFLEKIFLLHLLGFLNNLPILLLGTNGC